MRCFLTAFCTLQHDVLVIDLHVQRPGLLPASLVRNRIVTLTRTQHLVIFSHPSDPLSIPLSLPTHVPEEIHHPHKHHQ
jgi:hypothetical protein